MHLLHLVPFLVAFCLSAISPSQALCPNWHSGPARRDADGLEIRYIHYDDLPTVGSDFVVRDEDGKVLHDGSALAGNPITEASFDEEALNNSSLAIRDAGQFAKNRHAMERRNARCGMPPFVCAVMSDGMYSDSGPKPVKIHGDPNLRILMRYYNQQSTHFVGKKGSVVWYPAHGCQETCVLSTGGITFLKDRKTLKGNPRYPHYKYCTLTFTNIYQSVNIFEF